MIAANMRILQMLRGIAPFLLAVGIWFAPIPEGLTREAWHLFAIFIAAIFAVIVNALRKFESAGVIESKSLGMKGTYIKVLNEHLLEEVQKLKR